MKIPEISVVWDECCVRQLRKVMSEENILRAEGVRAEEMGKEENRSQLGPTATRGGLGTIHRNQV